MKDTKDRRTLRSRARFSVFAWTVLAYNLVVILWGALVRATGSGAGCGSHWPLCNGVVLPEISQFSTRIEFTHRLTSGIAFLSVLTLFFLSRRIFAKGQLARKAAAFSVILIILEALIGAGLVLFELVAENTSTARALSISIHLVNTYLLLGALTLTAYFSQSAWQVSLQKGAKFWLLLAGFVGLILLGMTGAITALGDTLFPATTIGEGLAQDFAPSSHFLVRLRVLHPLLAVVTGAYLLAMSEFVYRRSGDQIAPSFRSLLTVFVSMQLLAGLINVLLLAPIWMQLLHLLLADLIWIVFVLFALSSLSSQRDRGLAESGSALSPAEVL